MQQKCQPVPATAQEIESRIHIVRDVLVIRDSDLAELYGVLTSRLKEQVNRNPERFPSDFAFQLERQEFIALMSQIATSKPGRGGHRNLPWVFTEQGVAMLSSVIRLSTVALVQIEIMRAFVRLRRLLSKGSEWGAQLTQLAETAQMRDQEIRVIQEISRKMMELPAPPETTACRVGFTIACAS